jgi:uncharacterized protein
VVTVSFNTPRRSLARVALAFAGALVLLGGCASSDDASPLLSPPGSLPSSTGAETSATAASTSLPDARQRPVGFESVAAVVVPSGDAGEPCELCVWVADDGERRSRGLMQVDDLGGRDGMIFVYDSPRTTRFTMRNTLLPLSIAFFDADGIFLEAFDMEPCSAEPCPSYPTPSDFLVAIEVPQGRLDALGIGPGASLEVLDRTCG